MGKMNSNLKSLDDELKEIAKDFLDYHGFAVLKYIANSGTYNDYTGSMRHSFQALIVYDGKLINVKSLHQGDIPRTSVRNPIVIKRKEPVKRTIVNKRGKKQKTTIRTTNVVKRIAYLQTPPRHGVYRKNGKYFINRDFKRQHKGISINTIDKVKRKLKNNETGRPYRKRGYFQPFINDRNSAFMIVINNNPYSRYLQNPDYKHKLYGKGVDKYIADELRKEFMTGSGEFKSRGIHTAGTMKGTTYKEAVIEVGSRAIEQIFNDSFNRRKRRI